ncbi:cyclic nucleotide-binding domain-containing protein [Parathalassolituus penaei]|uniref:Cyclic nucleotide-binding domain-containing protein n=1 Tax=Parathalassolituus penaei TaxID=2997323 RepID=A0A9X3EFY7_9GAMM|nr:cyclic nucleotide-binding domain-containing protein [Parathalassolituus penaei]MCY0966025.1 cyclic nucleotide-binding domain-containing protein [Parathalassolituus penaei]
MHPLLTPERLKNFIPFDDLSENAIGELLPHFIVRELPARKILFKRGDAEKYCYFLLQGQVDLVDDRFQVNRVEGDDDANILALDATHAIHRNAAITQTDAIIAVISRQHVELISTWLELSHSYREEPEEQDWLEALLTSDLFNKIPPGNIQKLINRFAEREVKLGDVIISQGDEASECYVIKRGRALVTRQTPKGLETLAALGAGALFGEDALISQLPRSANITMSSDGILMVLNKDDFDQLLKSLVLEYIEEADLDDLIENSDTGVVLLDVRNNEEIQHNPIPRSRAMPLARLRTEMRSLDKVFMYVIIGGGRAEAAAYILIEDGYQVKVMRQPEIENKPAADSLESDE